MRVGDRIRINAQLVDASTGAHLWAERYDGTMEDVFALQDQVIQHIVSALAIELTGSGETQVAQSETDDPGAYDAFLKGWALLQRGGPDRGAAAIPYFEQAVRRDPEYGRAYAALALTYRGAIEQRWARRLDLSYGEANDKAKEY